jgi:hypothetical protein
VIAWTPPVTVPTNASGTPALVSVAGKTVLVVADVSGTSAATARSTVLEVGVPGRRIIAARNFTALRGLTTVAGKRIVVAGMGLHGRRLRAEVRAGKPGTRLRLLATLPGRASSRLPPGPPGPGPSLSFFPAGNEPAPEFLNGVAVPVAIAGNARGDIAVLIRRRAGAVFDNGLELWLAHAGRRRVVPISPPGRGLGPTAVAIDARGNVLAAWKRGGSVYAKTIGARTVSRTSRLGPTELTGPVRALLPRRGRGVVARGSQTGSFDGPAGPFRAFVTVQRGSGFSKRRLLGSAPADDGFGFAAGVLLAPLPGAATAVVWSGGAATATVQSATIAGRLLTRGPDVGPGRLEALAPARDGSTGVVTSTQRLSVSVHAAGAAGYDTPADLGQTTSIAPSIVFDASSRPTIAWRDFRAPILVSSGAPSATSPS